MILRYWCFLALFTIVICILFIGLCAARAHSVFPKCYQIEYSVLLSQSVKSMHICSIVCMKTKYFSNGYQTSLNKLLFGWIDIKAAYRLGICLKRILIEYHETTNQQHILINNKNRMLSSSQRMNAHTQIYIRFSDNRRGHRSLSSDSFYNFFFDWNIYMGITMCNLLFALKWIFRAVATN